MNKILLLASMLLLSVCVFAQNAYWKTVRSNEVTSFTNGKDVFPGKFKPTNFKLFSLKEDVFSSLLKQAQLSKNISLQSGLLIYVPVADGSIERFRVAESSVMSEKLQAKYPQIRSYVGQGVDDPYSIIHFDFSPVGFHAIIISPTRKTIYINPVVTAKTLYAVFDRSNIAQEKQVFDCNLDRVLNSEVQGTTKPVAPDGKLRTYRFAVTTGGEFSQLFLDGTERSDAERKAKVMAGLVTDLVRTNAIFETDFGIHLNYIDNEDTIIFLDSKTDPFQSSSIGYITGKWNKQCQQTMDTYIGAANYDVGHLLMGFPTGGNAGCIGCVCHDSNKGSGATGFTDDLTSDPFIVDFWDHEIGHQFGGNHTFDYSYEGTIAQMEPGSGSTIMGYAGTTGETDIQPHSDPYFHAISVQQVDTYTQTGLGNTCAVITSTTDHSPTINAGADYTIPASTPFILTAANASDNDVIDSLTYCWEQFDVYKKGTSYKYPEDTSTTGPVFRSLTPTISSSRTFPALASILDGTNTNEWEVLPGVSRTLNFRVTVRDNHAGGGSTASDDMVVTVVGNSEPFKVTYPNSAVTLTGGTKKTITWNVANTNLAPINCTNVKIFLSTDGGQTFTLVGTKPNTGAATIIVPKINTTQARIKIAGAGNIFFDISDADFTINTSALIASNASANMLTNKTSVNVMPNPAKDFTNVIFHNASDKVDLELSASNGKVVYYKTLNDVIEGVREKISLAGLAKGIYMLKITTDNGTQVEKVAVY